MFIITLKASQNKHLNFLSLLFICFFSHAAVLSFFYQRMNNFLAHNILNISVFLKRRILPRRRETRSRKVIEIYCPIRVRRN